MMHLTIIKSVKDPYWSQCGSRSGSSILGQCVSGCGSGSGSRSRVFMLKNFKKLRMKKKLLFLLIKNCNLVILRLQPSALKREHPVPTFKKFGP
jgi:hypothetical protein